jgi:hypothetical protein
VQNKRLSLVGKQMKVSIRFLHSTNEKLIKRLPKDYDLVRIALEKTVLDGILVSFKVGPSFNKLTSLREDIFLRIE